ncbi:hypothetical protein G4Z16_19555 [Streptomyces bathyalis]|uniref:UvrABC system protein A n=1 Tax=Streptomyces bathyalis TaxID=2710756 RepID=A0A7T1T271_9ACTN|nr:hypothetical protein [Streptomyces bathyalis]QPP05026.1 hypothetical protein G4Z16_19555 [Streptomyces bathyalis]
MDVAEEATEKRPPTRAVPPSPGNPHRRPDDAIRISGARLHNLKNASPEVPKNSLVVLTGLSGSGKSTLAFDTLHREGGIVPRGRRLTSASSG